MEISQVLQALKNADAAGDVEAAKELANIAKGLLAPTPSAPEEPKEKPDTGFTGALKAGTAGAKGSAALLAGKLGLMNADAAEAYNREQEAYAKKAFAPTQESWGQAPFTHLKELAGGSLPYMVAPAAAALLAPEATVGAGLASLAQFTGTNLGRQVEEGKSLKDASLGAAALAAVPQAALDVMSLKMLPGVRGLFGKAGIDLTEKTAQDIAKKGLTNTLGSYAAVTGKAAGMEGLTEAAQQVFERLQAGLSLTDPEARDEYLQNFIGGAALGGTLAPVGHAFERSGQRTQNTPPVLGSQPQPQQPVPAPEATQIPEPTVRGEEPELETPEEIAAGPSAKAQAAQAKKLAAEQAAFLKQYEEQAALREQQAAEYERIKALSPEEYALEQMQGIKAKKTKPASQEELNAQLAELGYQTKPTPVTPPPVPGADYAAQQIAIAKDREPQLNNKLLSEYLMQDPEQARTLVQNQTPIPDVSQKDSTTLLSVLKAQIAAYDKQQAQQKAQTETTAQDRARGLFAQQSTDQTPDFMAGAREQRGNAVVRPEVQALQRIGERPAPYLTANRDVEETRKTEGLVNKLVETLPVTDGSITPGDVFLGLGAKKQDVRDLQAQLAVARMTRNRDQQNELRRQLDQKRAIPTEGGLGTEGGKTAAEFLGRSKLPQARVNEAEGDKFATEQRSTLLGMARTLASPKITLPATRQKTLSDAKETYVAQHAAEIEARRKAFGLPPMEDWERAEARARVLEGLNTLTNNWNQFEDKVVSVKALQNIAREAVYQNLYKAVARKTTEQKDTLTPKLQAPKGQRYFFEDQEGKRIESKTMETPRQTGPRLAGPKELELKKTPNIAATSADAAQQFIEQVLSQVETKGRTRVEPVTTQKPAARVGNLANIAKLFKQVKTGGREVNLDETTVELLESLREGLRTNTDPEFVNLARETAQKIAEGNLPSEYDIRDLDEMMKAHEVAGRSETRPGTTSEELQRTSAQPQKELFPEAAVQTQRATPSNFQKMLDSKDVQGMRDAIEKQRKDNIDALQKVSKALPTFKNKLAKAEENYKRTQKRAEAAGTEANAYVSEYKTALQNGQDLIVALRDELVRLEEQLKDVEITKDLLVKEPTDIRFLINAQKMLATETPLRRGIKLLETEITNAKTFVASVEASYKAQQTLVVPAQRRAEKTREELDKAQAELSAAKNEANAASKRAERLEQANKEAKERAERELGTSREEFNKSAQAGREGLGLEGMRVQRDTAALKDRENELRSKLGSLEDQLDKAKNEKKKTAIQAKIDETTQELDALPSMAPAVRTDLGNLTAADLAFEAEQIKNARKLNTQLGLTAGLPAPIKGPIEKNIRTGRTTQGGQRFDRVGKTDAVTNALVTRRGELSDINMRIGMLEQAKKPIPEKLAKLKDRAEKRVEKAQKAQEAVAALEKDTRAALSTANRKNIEVELKRAAEANEMPQFARGVETTSPDLTVSQVKALEDNDIRQAMNDIAADGNTSKLNQVVAQRLAAMLDNTDVKVERSLKDEAGKSVLGMATSKLVQLNRNGGLSQEILLHEGTHAATERVIVQYETDPSKLTEIQRVAVRELKALHAAIKNDPRITSASAKGSLSEFVAEVFSNKNLQDQLSQKKWRLSDAWKGFKSIIMRMLGVKDPETMLGAALQSIDALMVPSSDRTVGGKETAVSRRLSAKDIAALHDGSNSMKQFADQFGTTAIKQKDRTAEDANRIGQDYLDDMYANPMDYVAPADRLDYVVRGSDGKPFDMDNALHYVEADAADFAMLKAQEDFGLQERESLALTANRKKDLRALVKNMMETPEFTYVEQALVAKAASKFAVLSDKSGKLKLASIEPNNRHDIAVVSAEDAGRIIEELRAGKPLKTAFLHGMQKNADANAKKNKRKNGWQKFEQSDTEAAAIALNAGAANTPWCTAANVNTARSQISKGDFYIYYKDGRPEVAVRMDGTDKIGEVRGNSPNQSINKEQEAIARAFLQQNKFEKANKYLQEFDTRKFVVELLKGETDYSLEELFNNTPDVDSKGKVTARAASKLLDFRTLDGYGGRPPATKVVGEQIRKRIQSAMDDAEKMGYYPTKSLRISKTGADFGGTPVELATVKGVGSVTVSSYAQKEDGYVVMPDLEYADYIGTFTNLKLLKLKSVNKLVIFADENEKPIVVSTPKDTKINNVRSAEDGGGSVIIEGPERVDGIKLQDDYGARSTLNVTLPDTKYVSIAAPGDSFERSIAYRARHIMQDAGMPANIDTEENFTKIYEGIHALANAISSDVSDIFENKLSDPELQGDLDTARAYYSVFAASILEHGGYTQAQQGSLERQTAANKIAKSLNQAWSLEKSAKFGEKSGTLTAPKRVTETFTEEAETPRYARAQATGFEDELATASELIAKPTTVRQKIEANLGLAFRTQVLDRLAPLEKVAAEQMDAFKGMQMMYYLRMADQKMSFVQQSVGRGVPQMVEKQRADGNVERLIESQNGPNLVNVVNTLKAAPGMNAQAANQLFTLYLAAKRADRVGYDVLNFGASEASIKSAVAKIEANKELRDVFEKARGQYNEYNRDLVKFLEATGAITPEEAARLAKTNDYIPYYREQNGNAVLVIGGEGTFKVGNLTDQPQLRQLIGGNEKILDFLTSSVQNTSMIMDMGLRNQAAKNAMFELADLGMAQFLGGQPSGPDIVRFKDKGVEKFVRIDTAAAGIPADLLVKGMEGIPVNNSAVVQAMGGFSTLLRRAITVSPLYSARQVFRDSVAAPLLSGADFTPVIGALKQIGKSDTREKLESRGIVGGQILTGTNEDLTRILGELQSGKMGIGQFIAKAEAIAMEADALTRRAQYDSYIAQGLSDMEATLMSLESMNFNRKGLSPSARFLSTVIPFFNAQLQSLDVLYRAMTGKMPMNERLDIQGKLLRRGALLASTSVAYALLMQDDDTYKNANPDEKYNNFFVHVPGIKEAIRVPVPFEIGYIFKSLPEAIVNSMNSEHGSEEAYKAFKNIAIQTVPGGTSLFLPAALKPVVEGVTNYSFFTGRSLETKREQMEQAQYRYRDNTSEIAKQIGAATGTSPIKIDNLIRGYTGGMGVALAQAFNFAMPTNGTPEQATKRLSDAAVIGPLFQPEDAGGVVGSVYDRVQTLVETKRTYDGLIKSGQRAEATEFLQRNMDDYAKSAIAGNVQEQLAKVTQAVNAVKASSMSPDEKRESLDRLQKLRIMLAASVRGAL